MNTRIEEQASLYVLDKLSSEERNEFELVMEQESEVKQLVHELEDGLAVEVRKLPQYKPSENTFQSIQARIHETETEVSDKKVIQFSWASLSRLGVAAVFLLGVGLTFLITSNSGAPKVYVVGMGAHSSQTSTLDSSHIQFESDDHFAQLASLAADYWDHPESNPVKIAANHTENKGYAVFDAETNSGFIAINHLPKLEKGKHYRLWVSDPQTKKLHNAGSIPLHENNKGLYYFSLETELSTQTESVEFFVTEEAIEDKETSHPKGRRVLGNDEL